jgi:peptidoglycan/LPS O-acetylase OafA/YrhL
VISTVVKLAMTALFVWSCVLQLNDHDGLWWILLYGLGAVVTLVSLFRGVRRWALAAAVFYVVVTLVVAVGVDRWSVDSERAREALGIAISAVWMFAVSRLPGGRVRTQSSPA